MSILNNINQFFVIVPNLIAVPIEQKEAFLQLKDEIVELQADKIANETQIKLCVQQLKTLAYHYYSNTNGNYVSADDAMYEVHLHKPQWFDNWKRLASTASRLHRIQSIVQHLATTKLLNVPNSIDSSYQRVISTLQKRIKENADNYKPFAEVYVIALSLHFLFQSFNYQCHFVRNDIKGQDNYSDALLAVQIHLFSPNDKYEHDYKCFINLTAPSFVYDKDLTLNNRNKENDFVLQFLLSYFPKPQSADASIV